MSDTTARPTPEAAAWPAPTVAAPLPSPAPWPPPTAEPGTTAARRSVGLGRATAVLSLATIAASAANYVLNLLLARWLVPAAFGDATLIVTLLLVVTAVAMTLQLVAARRTSGSSPTKVATVRRAILRRAWLLGSAAAAIVVAASPLLRDATSSASALPFALLAIGLPVFLAQAVERGVLQGQLRFGALAWTRVVEAVARVGVAVALVLAGHGVSGATLGISLSFLASWLLARHLTRGALPADPPSSIDVASSAPTREERLAAQAATILLVGQVLVNNGDVVLAKIMFDPDAAGVHSIVALVGRAVFFLSWAVVTAAFPMAAGADADPTIERRAVRLVTLMSLGVTAAVAIVAPAATPALLGAGYEQAAALFLPYAIATTMFAIANVGATLAAANGRRLPAVIVVAAGAGQAALLGTRADDLHTMSWLQVVAMTALLVALVVERRLGSIRATRTAARSHMAVAP